LEEIRKQEKNMLELMKGGIYSTKEITTHMGMNRGEYYKIVSGMKARCVFPDVDLREKRAKEVLERFPYDIVIRHLESGNADRCFDEEDYREDFSEYMGLAETPLKVSIADMFSESVSEELEEIKKEEEEKEEVKEEHDKTYPENKLVECFKKKYKFMDFHIRAVLLSCFKLAESMDMPYECLEKSLEEMNLGKSIKNLKAQKVKTYLRGCIYKWKQEHPVVEVKGWICKKENTDIAVKVCEEKQEHLTKDEGVSLENKGEITLIGEKRVLSTEKVPSKEIGFEFSEPLSEFYKRWDSEIHKLDEVTVLGLEACYKSLESRGLDGVSWFKDAYLIVYRKVKTNSITDAKRAVNYFVSMIRNWENYGKGCSGKWEDKFLFMKFESISGGELSERNRKSVYSLMGEFGVFAIYAALNEYGYLGDAGFDYYVEELLPVYIKMLEKKIV
jgi:hypothetical protein